MSGSGGGSAQMPIGRETRLTSEVLRRAVVSWFGKHEIVVLLAVWRQGDEADA